MEAATIAPPALEVPPASSAGGADLAAVLERLERLEAAAGESNRRLADLSALAAELARTVAGVGAMVQAVADGGLAAIVRGRRPGK